MIRSFASLYFAHSPTFASGTLSAYFTTGKRRIVLDVIRNNYFSMLNVKKVIKKYGDKSYQLYLKGFAIIPILIILSLALIQQAGPAEPNNYDGKGTLSVE